jgi:hypothetical protein
MRVCCLRVGLMEERAVVVGGVQKGCSVILLLLLLLCPVWSRKRPTRNSKKSVAYSTFTG